MSKDNFEDDTPSGFSYVTTGRAVHDRELTAAQVRDFQVDNLPAWAREVHERIDAEGLYLADYDPQEVIPFAVYRKGLPDWARPYADAWDTEIRKLTRRAKISVSAVWRLQSAMRRDVYETCQSLVEAPQSVRDAWAAWYVPWVRAELDRLLAALPWLGKSAMERHREKQAHYRRKDRRKREQALDKRLLEHVEVNGGSVVWDPKHLGKAVALGRRSHTVEAIEGSVSRLSALGLLRQTRRPRSYQPGDISRLVLLAANASESYGALCKPLKQRRNSMLNGV